MVSIAGIRGVVGDSLRLDEFVNYAQGFMAELNPRRIVLGADTRASGEMLRHLLYAAAMASGVEVLDLGIVPTPTVGFMVRHLKTGGGIVLSASHNPPQWNALKFFSDQGSFLTPDQFKRLLESSRMKFFHRADVKRLGRLRRIADPTGPHLRSLLRVLPVAAIRRRKFRVVLDACNGAGLGIARDLFKALGVRFQVIHDKQDGNFDRPPEPLPENLAKLQAVVRRYKADVGFALDPDADRLAVVDETGRAIGEERTIVLAIQSVYDLKSGVRSARSRNPAVVNLSTTRAVEDVAARYGIKVERTPIGEAHVVNRMKTLNSEIGGEGNGGVIFPKVHPGRDSATGMGLILALMSFSDASGKRRKLSQINAEVPDYIMQKDKITLPGRSVFNSIHADQLSARANEIAELIGCRPIAVDRSDGVKFILPDAWLHIRASGTEPIVRLFAEAPKVEQVRRLLSWTKRYFRQSFA